MDLDYYKQIERALGPIRQQHLELARSIKLSGLASSGLTGLIQANQHWQDLVSQAMASSDVFENMERTHQTWLDVIKPLQESIAGGLQAAAKLYPLQESIAGGLQAAAKLSLGNVTYWLTVTESLFAGIDFEALRRAVALPAPAFLKLENVVNDVMLTYAKLADSIRTLPDVTYLPDFTLPGATREVFTTGYALNAIQTSGEQDTEMDSSEVQLIAEVEKEISDCISLLRAVEPGLARPYVGAHDALYSGNTDRARHILSSLRELWYHLLRRLAPDDQVLAWAPTNNTELLRDGRPTWRGRILYIFRDLNHAPLTEFVTKDTDALVNLVNLFNHLHELELRLTDEQLRALLLKNDSWLMYILQTWDGTK